jgi:hypothetical protein
MMRSSLNWLHPLMPAEPYGRSAVRLSRIFRCGIEVAEITAVFKIKDQLKENQPLNVAKSIGETWAGRSAERPRASRDGGPLPRNY